MIFDIGFFMADCYIRQAKITKTLASFRLFPHNSVYDLTQNTENRRINMSEVNTKIGNYTITDVDIDTFISGMPQEQQMYRSMPEFRKQCEERLEEICLFAMYGEEEKKDETEMFKTSMVMAKRDILSQIAMAELLQDVSVSDAEAKEYFLGHSKEFASKASATAPPPCTT